MEWIYDRNTIAKYNFLTSNYTASFVVNDALEEKTLEQQGCRICEDAVKEVTFVPCGHIVACNACAQFLNECPVCRKAINSKVRIFSA